MRTYIYLFDSSNKQLLVVPITPAANCPCPGRPGKGPVVISMGSVTRGSMFKCKLCDLGKLPSQCLNFSDCKKRSQWQPPTKTLVRNH